MSKTDKLRKESLKQLEEKKAEVQEEKRRRQDAGESRSAARMRRDAKKFNSPLTLIIKILMWVPFLWSGLYYGGIFVLGISMDQMDDVPGRIAVFIAVGSLICLAGLVLAMLSLYIPQFAAILTGTVLFMQGASYIVNKAEERIASGSGLTVEQQGLADKWRFGLYPIMILAALSAALMGVYLVRRHLRKRRLQKEKDNAPVKSIVADD